MPCSLNAEGQLQRYDTNRSAGSTLTARNRCAQPLALVFPPFKLKKHKNDTKTGSGHTNAEENS
jgi:hypothetical protein